MPDTVAKKVSFIQYAQPGLEGGNYAISVQQAIGSVSGTLPDTTYAHESRFAVRGPRFSLGPDDVVSMFPPPFSLGEFTNVLPHAVLSRPTLPWERNLGVGLKANDSPWLGVILFDEDDPAPPIQKLTLLDLVPKTHTTAAGAGLLPPGTYFPPFPKDTNNMRELDFGESWTDACQVIDVPVALFQQVMPTADDAGWLAHVREIELANKTETYVRRLRVGATDSTPVGQVAEVVGNRFGRAGKRSVAHLVCLAEFGTVLQKLELPDHTTAVRLVSLKSWTFSAASQDYTFAGLLLNLNRPGGTFTQATLQVPYTDANPDPVVANAFKMGFTAFDHTTRQGDRTVSWFHGPFVPFNLQTSVPFPGNAADQFTRYNPDSGMFDVSYSAAFQLGRLLGLQSDTYSTALYNWKRSVTQQAITEVEQQFLNANHGEMVALLGRSLARYAGQEETPALAAAAPPDFAPGQWQRTARSPMIRPGRLGALRSTLTQPAALGGVLGAAGDPDVPTAVGQFLARLRLLYGVPFNYIAPDERMLPPESLRFFCVDNAWIDSLLEGALSIGNATSSDATVSHTLATRLRPRVQAGARAIRSRVLKMAAPAAPAGTSTRATGFLLRSQVVTGWPGMEVIGLDKDNNPLGFLRLEQVGQDVLLCMFDGVVQQLVIHEHPEALHFGVDEDPGSSSPDKFTKSFRYIVAVDGKEPGSAVPDCVAQPLAVPNYLRSGATMVLQVDKFAGAIQAALKNNVYSGDFTSAEFALEMIEGVQQVTFTFGGA